MKKAKFGIPSKLHVQLEGRMYNWKGGSIREHRSHQGLMLRLIPLFDCDGFSHLQGWIMKVVRYVLLLASAVSLFQFHNVLLQAAVKAVNVEFGLSLCCALGRGCDCVLLNVTLL
jgi:hypothetical protein